MNKILFGAFFFLICTTAAKAQGEPLKPFKWHMEYVAYMKFPDSKSPSDKRGPYLNQLSPGGKVYFLACRRDFQEALDALQKLPNNSSGSHLYVKAFCLQGLGKHQDAFKAYQEAKAKVDVAFHPGFRFYMDSGTASMMVGNEKEAIADFEIAQKKALDPSLNAKDMQLVGPALDKRKIFAAELKGRYEEAFRRYLVIFSKSGDPFHLNDSMDASEATKQKALGWLQNHSSVPIKATSIETAKFYVTQGKAYVATGNLVAAKKSLGKALLVEPTDRSPVLRERLSYDEHSPLTTVKDQAKIVLLKLAYKAGNYKDCCKYIRKLFARDPFDELRMYNNISMKDVPQLVLQRDVDKHHVEIEAVLDFCDLVTFSPQQGERLSEYVFVDPLFDRAADEVQESRFSACYDTLEQFLKTNSVRHDTTITYRKFFRAFLFDFHYSHSAKLFQIAVGIAANKRNLALSLYGGQCPPVSQQWQEVENVLLGRTSQTKVYKVSNVPKMTEANFKARCHFAAAVRAMSQRNFKLAAEKFAEVKLDVVLPKDREYLAVYTKALKKYCEQQK